MVERDRDIEERRVAEMAEKLSVYKREVSVINFNRFDLHSIGFL